MRKMLHTKAEVSRESIQKSDGILDAVVGSTEVLDRAGDTISQSGWKLSAYKKTNPVILWGHNVKEERPPIGKAMRVWVANRGKKGAKLMFKVQFDLQDTFAAEIFRKVKEGFINTVSVGFKPLEWELLDEEKGMGGRKYLKQELLELSFVPVPANPEAVVALKAMEDDRFSPVELGDMYKKKKKKVAKKKAKRVKKAKKAKKKIKKKVKKVKRAKKVKKKAIKPEKKVEKKPKKKETKSPACRRKGETKKECMNRKIPEIMDEDPTMDNDQAVAIASSLCDKACSEKEGADKTDEKVEDKETKGVIPFKDHGIAPESEAWDAGGEVKKADAETLKKMCAWYDSSKPESKTSYKLPHHKADGYKAVWRGVAAAMAALLGARGGVQIPSGDKKGVYNHLKRHYKQFDKEAPEFKAVEEQALAGFDEEIHALILDREDRYAVRLIKKVIRTQKKTKKVQPRAYSAEELEAALKIFELALSQALKGSKGGGDKTKG